MLYLHRIIFFILFFSFFSPINATPLKTPKHKSLENNLINRAEAMGLDQHEIWKKLLVYKNTVGETESYVLSENFFLSENGKSNPLAELRATISSMLAPAGKNPNHHAQCVFRGRYLWLKSQLDFDHWGITEQSCPDFDKWSYSNQASSVSLVFATGYLANPASYYGHVLLKINSKPLRQTSLQDEAVNFGAIIPDNENMLLYILKGLFGFYEAGFTSREYFYHTHNYGENDLRDVWEYQLNLQSYESKLIIGHAWGLLGKKFRYYFLDRNCAFHMAELFELAAGVKVVPRSPFWVFPQTLVSNLEAVSRDDKKLVSNVRYLASRQSRFYEKYNQLTGEEKSYLKKSVLNIQSIKDVDFSALSETSRKRVYQALIDYMKFMVDSKPNDENLKEVRRIVLARLFQLPPGRVFDKPIAPKSPGKGRKPSYLSAGFQHNSFHGNSVSLHLRPAYYDMLDSDSSHSKYSSLSMGEVKAELNGNSLKMTELNFVKIENNKHKATGLPGDTADYWYFAAQVRRDSLGCDSCLVPVISARKGRSGSLGKNAYVSGYAGIGVQGDSPLGENLFAELGTVGIARINSHLNVEARVGFKQFANGEKSNKFLSSIKARYKLSQNHDLRISYTRDEAEAISVSIGRYW